MVSSLQLSTFERSSKPAAARRLILIVLAIAVLAIALLVAAGAVAQQAHADIKHGADASLARQCNDGKHQLYLFHNAATNRYGAVCNLDGLWGILIVDEKGKEITAFVKNRMHRFEQVLQYMRNAGYEPIH